MLASQMTRRLLMAKAFEGAVDTILDDVIALLGAEYGNIQLLDAEELVIVAQRGLSADFLKTFTLSAPDIRIRCASAIERNWAPGFPRSPARCRPT